VATPLIPFSTGVCTRRNPSSLVNPALHLEKVLRVRLHKISSRTLLDTLGQEALSDIHSLFLGHLQQDIMDIFAPCNFANIQAYPHDFPQKSIDKLPSFQGNNAVSVKAHLSAFCGWWGKWSRGNNQEDVKMRLFVLTLEQDALE